MSGENEMVDEELVGGGEEGSAKVAPAPDAATTEGKTMTDTSTRNESQFALFLVLIASVVLVVATGAAYDWDIRVSRIQILTIPPDLCIPVECCSVLIIIHAT